MGLKSRLFSMTIGKKKERKKRLSFGCKRNEEFEEISNNDSRAVVFLGLYGFPSFLAPEGQHRTLEQHCSRTRQPPTAVRLSDTVSTSGAHVLGLAHRWGSARFFWD